MIIVNPQWQGIGSRNLVPQGAELIKTLLNGIAYQELPLDDSDIQLEDNVKGLTQISALIAKARTLLDQKKPDAVFTCGGDCSSDFAQIAYMNEKYNGDMAIIWVDAHGDLHTPESSPSKNFHGMPIRALMGDGHPDIIKHVPHYLKPEQLSFFGLRSTEDEEEKFIEDYKVPVYTTEKTASMDIASLNLSSNNVYLHVDIDSLDQTVYNECATPTSGGFTLENLTTLISTIMKNNNIVGGCLTEYGPKNPQSSEHIVKTLLFDGFDIENVFSNHNEQPRNKAVS